MFNSTKPFTIIDESNRVFPLKDICHNTIYRSSNDIERQLFPLVDHSDKSNRYIPEELDGRVVWNDYLTNLFFQQTSSWNCAIARALSSRFAILSAGEIAPNLSYDFLAFCPEKVLIDPFNYPTDPTKFLEKSTYYGASYTYSFGTTYNPCFEYDNKFNKESHEDCLSLLKKNKNYTCANEDNVFRFFRSCFITNIANNVKSIKYELSKFGPLVATMNVYEDFNTFDGLSEYSEIKSDKKIGARSVVIIGWIKNDKNEDYWIIDPCIGYSWGLGGYFLCKTGLSKLGIEDSVISIYPDFEIFSTFVKNLYKDLRMSPQLTQEREKIKSDNKYFIIKDTISQEDFKKVKHSSTYINPRFLPSYDTFFAKDIGLIPATIIKKKKGMSLSLFIISILIYIAFFLFFLKMYKK